MSMFAMSTQVADSFLIGQTLGFGAGLVIAVLLLLLIRRVSILTTDWWASYSLAAGILLWNLFGLIEVLLLVFGFPRFGTSTLLISAAAFSGAALLPVSFLALWRRLATAGSWQDTASRWLYRVAILNAVWIILCLFATALIEGFPVSNFALRDITSYNGSILLAVGAVILLRGSLTTPALRLYLAATLIGMFGTTLGVLLHNLLTLPPGIEAILLVFTTQSVLLIVLGAFLFFTKFRFSDVFVKSSLRVFAAALLAFSFWLLIDEPLPQAMRAATAFPEAARVITATTQLCGLLLIFAGVSRGINWFVDRRLFPQPDYRAASHRLWDQLNHLESETEIFEMVDTTVCATLELQAARVVPLSSIPRDDLKAGISKSEVYELTADNLDRLALSGYEVEILKPIRCPVTSRLRCAPKSKYEVDILVPIRVGGIATHVLSIAPGMWRRNLLSNEVAFLREAALQIGSRLEALRFEQQRMERQVREARLQHQVTKAELRALRAQINPHFLFNSLNTIADLIVADPAKAEIMTIRLAKVFRHVLMHSDCQMTSVSEEIKFLRTYLDIEEVRFGDRLQVSIEVDPSVSQEKIPSLILQPLVENAIKHGLAPKLGVGRLSISAQSEGEYVRLAVEDDGLGPPVNSDGMPNGSRVYPPCGTERAKSNGVGLRNIGERLSTLYQGRASVSFEARPEAGSRVTILIPRVQSLEGVA